MRHKMQKVKQILSNKIKVAAKEIEETKYWLLLCEKSPAYPFNPVLKDKINELGLIVYKIISTSKNNR